MIGRGPLAAFLLLFVCVAAPVAAAQRDQRQPIEIALDDVREGRFAHGLAQADLALQAAVGDPARIAGAQFMRSMALMGLERRDQSRAAARIALDTTDRPEFAAGMVSFFVSAGDPEGGQALLGRYLDRFGYRARDLETTSVGPLLGFVRQNQGKPAWEALIVRLANGGYGGDNLQAHDYAALNAANVLLAQGKADEARSLADEITLRSVAIDGLIDRQYQALWPMIEQSAGLHLERIGRAAVIEAEPAGKATDASVIARRALFHAYRDAMLYDRADTFAASFATTPDERAALDEDGGWLINDHALLLAARGRIDDADKRFSAITTLPIAGRPWLISMILNRADMLVGHKREAAALPLIDEAATLAQTYGSSYARQLVRVLKVCALHGLGRDAEAQALGPDLDAHAGDNPATFEGYFCLGRDADAEAHVIRTLGDADKGTQLISALQPAGAEPPPDPSLLTGHVERLRAMPSVMTAMARIGRELPERLWPTPVDPAN